MRHTLRFLLTGFWMLAVLQLFATHIVGGEMSYRCLGNQEYEVVLTVYRDCYNGVPWFDDPASIGVFDANGVLIEHLKVPYLADDTLKPVLNDDCFVLPPNACVHTTTYRDTVHLQVSPGGYTLVYQRCCRNMTILNLVDPDETGATFSIYISEDALLTCNNSPVFKSWPPIYICVNEPIDFDHAAVDSEGDSIVYRLCTPLDGGTLQVPQPVPPVPPPYEEVVWLDPPYDLSNVMGGDPLTINPATGWLTGIPNTVGQFVVGICADEYRSGKLISSTRRDFQYNVGICGMTVSSFATPVVNCGLTVKFQNKSANADDYLWYFDVKNDPAATSSDPNPVFTYPDSGTYTVMLIAEPNDPCVDTFIQEIRVERLSILADFDYNFPVCDDSLTLSVIDQSTDTISTILQWAWTLSNTGAGKQLVSSEQFPIFQIDTSGIWILNLVVTAENGCKDTSRIIFPVQLPQLPWVDTTWQICQGDTIHLNPFPNFGANLNYTWSPGQILSNPKARDPLAWPDTTTLFKVKTTSMNSLCQSTSDVLVEVSPPIQWSVPPDTVVCTNPVWLSVDADRPVDVVWAADPGFMNILATGSPAAVTPGPDSWVYVHVSDIAGCEAVDSFRITNQATEVFLPDTLLLCPPGMTELAAQFPDPSDTIQSVHWFPVMDFPSGNDTNPAFLGPLSSGEYLITVEALNQFGCPGSDSSRIVVLDTTGLSSAISSVPCSGYQVRFELASPGAFAYTWSFGDGQVLSPAPSGTPVSHTFPGPGVYQVMAFIQVPGACADTIFTEVHLEDPPVQLALDWTYLHCADTADVLIVNQSVNGNSFFTGIQWQINGVDAGHQDSIQWSVPASGTLQVRLITSSENGCRDTLLEELSIPVIHLDPQEEVSLCPGDSVRLNLNGDPAYTYQWSPVSGLSDPSAASPWVTATTPQVYSVTATFTSPDTCSLTRDVQINLYPLPVYQIPPDTLICDTLAFLKAIVASQVSTKWFNDPQHTQLLINGNQILYPVFPVKEFYLEFTNNFGCRSIDSLNVRSAYLGIGLPDSLFLCPGDSFVLTAGLQGDTTGLELLWSGQGAWTPGSDPASVLVFGNEPITLVLEGVNAWGCQDLATSQVVSSSVGPLPVIQAEPPVIIAGQSSQLSVTGGTGWTFSWMPSATLNDPHIADPVATPDSTTVYEVLVTDPHGCTGSASVRVTVGASVCDDPYIFVPNTFTPNGDLKNDILYVRGPYIEEMIFMIYDRWGNLVFQTTDPKLGWDGTFKGKPLGNDVFGYYLEARCFNGEVFTRKGNVTLLRL